VTQANSFCGLDDGERALGVTYEASPLEESTAARVQSMVLPSVGKGDSVMSNKELVRTALTAVFINGDVTAVDKYWSGSYIQHNPQVPNGHDSLKQLLSTPIPNFKYELGLAIEEGDFVMVHGRYTGLGPKPLVGVDIFRVKDGQLAEHWDVLQEEVPAENTASGNAMFPIV
jgi:predicted SnoaL-like aldol condensation-catalyzing enzyme